MIDGRLYVIITTKLGFCFLTHIPYLVELVIDSLDAWEEGLSRQHLHKYATHSPA